MTPYAAQVALLRELLAGEVAAGVEVDSVDGFQVRHVAASAARTCRPPFARLCLVMSCGSCQRPPLEGVVFERPVHALKRT